MGAGTFVVSSKSLLPPCARPLSPPVPADSVLEGLSFFSESKDDSVVPLPFLLCSLLAWDPPLLCLLCPLSVVQNWDLVQDRILVLLLYGETQTCHAAPIQAQVLHGQCGSCSCF